MYSLAPNGEPGGFFVASVTPAGLNQRMSLSLIFLCKPLTVTSNVQDFLAANKSVCKALGENAMGVNIVAFYTGRGYAAMDDFCRTLKDETMEFFRFDIPDDKPLYGAFSSRTVEALESFTPKHPVYNILGPPPA